MKAARGRFDGVLDIVRYNTRFYAASLFALASIGATLWFVRLPLVAEGMLIAAALVAGFWTASSLLVSYYVYDYAGVTRWQWLPPALAFRPRRWVNVHAGLDESSATLAQFFAGSESVVIDIYDAGEMTEPSIARARELRMQPGALAGRLDALPLPDESCDTLFLLFAAHEIRNPARRTIFFREAARVLAGSGQVLLVEHLRDWKNFLAFGPGFLHFLARAEWLRVAREAGLAVEREEPVTPFVRCFLLRKAATERG